MQIAIVDDNAKDCELLKEYIEQYFKDKGLEVGVEYFINSESFLAKSNQFSLLFLDIYMGEENGMDTAKQLRQLNYEGEIMFVTSSKDFAIEGYQVKAAGYLVKPFTYDTFVEMMDLCGPNCHNKKDYIEIKEGRIMVKIRLCDILYSDYFNHYIQIHTKRHLYRTYLSFPEFSKMMAPYANFLTCYRNLIVNLDYVKALETKDFVLQDDTHIPITKAKRQEVRQAYADYLFEKLSEKSSCHG